MGLGRSVLLWSSRNRWIENQFRKRRFAKKAVSRFMPGDDPESALAVSRTLKAAGITTVVTRLGENVASAAEVEGVVDHYISVLGQSHDLQLGAHISIKPTQLGLDIDPDSTAAHVERLAAHAASLGNVVWIDMEASNYVDATLDIFDAVRAKHDNVGICLQAYLRRTPGDVERVLAVEGAIRLVKGAYQEPHDVAMPRKRDVDATFLKLSKQIVEHASRGVSVKPGIATHDTKLLSELERFVAERGWDRAAYEVQMLYGIRRAEQARIAATGVPVRILVSYGDAWFTWYMRRLAERPANVGFVLRSMLWR